MAFVNFLVTGIVLAFSITFASGSLSEITYLTAATVEKVFPAHLVGLFGNENQASRFKRDVITKKLDDPNGCITKCNSAYASNMINDGLKNAMNLVKVALGVKGPGDKKTDTPAEQAAFKKRVEDVTISNMGPMFADFCTDSNKVLTCYQPCADNNLKTIYTWHNTDGRDFLCEPNDKKYWKDFSEYYAALKCVNETKYDKPCDGKCGKEIGVRNVTGPLELKGGSALAGSKDDNALQYEDNKAKNTAAVGPACKNILCHEDCYKPLVTRKCGQKAYDMLARQAIIEPRFSLRVLNLMNAVGKNNDCKDFQQ